MLFRFRWTTLFPAESVGGIRKNVFIVVWYERKLKIVQNNIEINCNVLVKSLNFFLNRVSAHKLSNRTNRFGHFNRPVVVKMFLDQASLCRVRVGGKVGRYATGRFYSSMILAFEGISILVDPFHINLLRNDTGKIHFCSCRSFFSEKMSTLWRLDLDTWNRCDGILREI